MGTLGFLILAGCWRGILLSTSVPLPDDQVRSDPLHEHMSFSDPKLTAIVVRSNQARKQTLLLINEGKTKQANTYLSDFQKKNPDTYDFTEDFGIECELLAGRIVEAARRAQAWATRPGHDSDDTKIPLFLAEALRGQSTSSQRQFARKVFKDSLFPSQTKDTLSIPDRLAGTPQEAAILFSLAMAFKSPGRLANNFFELALKVDPSNYFATREDIRYYEFRGEYQNMRAIAARSLRFLPKGTLRDEIQAIQDRVKNLKDGRPKST